MGTGVKNEKTLILGLGNTILSDDAVGIIVARKVYNALLELGPFLDVEFREASYAGWRLIDIISGFRKAVIIDAIQGAGGKLGECYQIEQAQVNSIHLQSAHGIGLNTALEMAKQSGIKMPEEISIYAVEVKNPYEFGENISPEVESKIPGIAAEIIRKRLR